MTSEKIRTDVLSLASSHAGDHDGGYELVSSLRLFHASLGPEDRSVLEAILLQFVLEMAPVLWGVSLEVLAQENAVSVAETLAVAASDLERPSAWRGHVIHALLRIGWEPDDRLVGDYVSAELDRGQSEVLPILAAWCSASAEARGVAARHFAVTLGQSKGDDTVVGYIPAFVRNLQNDAAGLAEIVRRTKRISADAGESLAQLIRSYLRRDYVKKELGASGDAIVAWLDRV